MLRRLTSSFQQHSVCHPILTSPTRTHRGANKLSEHTTTTLHPTRNPTACAPGLYLRLSFLVVFFFAPLCRVFHPLFFSFLPSPPPLTHPHYHHHSPPGPRPAFHPPAVSSCDLRLSPLPPFCRRPTYKKNTKTLDHAHTPHDRDSCFRVSWGLLKELACFNSVLAVCLFVRRAVSAAAHNYWRRRRPPWAQRRQKMVKMVCSIVLSAFLLLCSGGPLLSAPASELIHSFFTLAALERPTAAQQAGQDGRLFCSWLFQREEQQRKRGFHFQRDARVHASGSLALPAILSPSLI